MLLLAIGIAGCGRNDVTVYRVAKEQATPQSAHAHHAHDHSAEQAAGAPAALHYKVPAGWEETTPGEMRAASFKVSGNNGQHADVSVVPLPGMIGRDLENVNRWRTTVGLTEVTEEELAKLAQSVEVAGQSAQLYDQAGENPGSGDKQRIMVAILRREGVAWYFKMAGDDELVSQQKAAFVDFLKSVEFHSHSATASTELPASHPPIGNASTPAQTVPVAAKGESKPVWQVPAGWQEAAAGQFLVAKFTVGGSEGAQASINVSTSTGDGGGLAGNVNRWRGQLGLGQLSEAEIGKLATPLDTPAGKAMLVDMTGTDARSGQKARLVGAVVPQANQTWFFKLMGDEQLVAREKEAFSKFIQSTKYPNAS
ncbi:MAG TPA: hypothetical protein VEC99_03790 [Clostridia bacterium]|nr:hypothetical protein [Clostridia bacterium]